MTRLFGTDGIRGVADRFPLDQETVAKVGSSLSLHYKQKFGRDARFIIGRDTRESGERLENAFAAGAAANGAVIESAGVITTPGVAFLTAKFGFDAGIVVSASHNPYQDNGIKVFLPSGQKMNESMERLIEDDIVAGSVSVDHTSETLPDVSRRPEFHEAYRRYLEGGFADLKMGGKRIALDCANGAASAFAPDVFRHFGAEVIAVNDRPNGKNINHECGSLHLDVLRDLTMAEAADFGVAFDGDADRALLVDNEGNIVDGDAVLWILACLFKKHGGLENNTVVATVMSNIGLELALAGRGIKLLRASVGDKYVLEELLSSGSEIGGEQSGHIILPKKSLVGDGMMTALLVAEAVAESGKKLSELTAGFVRYPQILVNVKVREKTPFDSVSDIASASKKIESELHGKGRLLLRYSGTENLARVMIEGEDQHAIETQARELADVITAKLG